MESNETMIDPNEQNLQASLTDREKRQSLFRILLIIPALILLSVMILPMINWQVESTIGMHYYVGDNFDAWNTQLKIAALIPAGILFVGALLKSKSLCVCGSLGGLCFIAYKCYKYIKYVESFGLSGNLSRMPVAQVDTRDLLGIGILIAFLMFAVALMTALLIKKSTDDDKSVLAALLEVLLKK